MMKKYLIYLLLVTFIFGCKFADQEEEGPGSTDPNETNGSEVDYEYNLVEAYVDGQEETTKEELEANSNFSLQDIDKTLNVDTDSFSNTPGFFKLSKTNHNLAAIGRVAIAEIGAALVLLPYVSILEGLTDIYQNDPSKLEAITSKANEQGEITEAAIFLFDYVGVGDFHLFYLARLTIYDDTPSDLSSSYECELELDCVVSSQNNSFCQEFPEGFFPLIKGTIPKVTASGTIQGDGVWDIYGQASNFAEPVLHIDYSLDTENNTVSLEVTNKGYMNSEQIDDNVSFCTTENKTSIMFDDSAEEDEDNDFTVSWDRGTGIGSVTADQYALPLFTDEETYCWDSNHDNTECNAIDTVVNVCEQLDSSL